MRTDSLKLVLNGLRGKYFNKLVQKSIFTRYDNPNYI